MDNSLKQNQVINFIKDKKISIPVIILLSLNIMIFRFHIKLNSKLKDDSYIVENMIKILSSFKPFINCKEKIYIYMKEPKDIVHSNYAFHYSLSPCELNYEGESRFKLRKGFSFINRLHSDFSYTNHNIIYSTKDFILIKDPTAKSILTNLA